MAFGSSSSSSSSRDSGRQSLVVTVVLLLTCWLTTIHVAYNYAKQQQQPHVHLSTTTKTTTRTTTKNSIHSTPEQQQLLTAAAASSSLGWDDLWWITNFKDTVLRLDDKGMIVFPPEIKRLWIDVGTHKTSAFVRVLPEQPDLFLLGFEPALTTYQKCQHARCVVFWAACTSTPQPQLVELYIQRYDGQCNSLLRPNTNTTAALNKYNRICVIPKQDEKTGQHITYHVPGIPLVYLLERIPSHITVEFLKIDAQGYDLEVMKGALLSSSSSPPTSTSGDNQHRHPHPLPLVMTLEAMDVNDTMKLLYQGQPTLNEIKEYLQHEGYIYLKYKMHSGAIHEVNAFFTHNNNDKKDESLSSLLFGNITDMAWKYV